MDFLAHGLSIQADVWADAILPNGIGPHVGLGALADAGAEPHLVDAGDAAALTDAFRGADAAYVLLPFAPEVPDVHVHMARVGTRSSPQCWPPACPTSWQ